MRFFQFMILNTLIILLHHLAWTLCEIWWMLTDRKTAHNGRYPIFTSGSNHWTFPERLKMTRNTIPNVIIPYYIAAFRRNVLKYASPEMYTYLYENHED